MGASYQREGFSESLGRMGSIEQDQSLGASTSLSQTMSIVYLIAGRLELESPI